MCLGKHLNSNYDVNLISEEVKGDTTSYVGDSVKK